MIEFIRELNRNYLSIVHEDEREPDYTMKMVENNSISGLLSLRKSVVNNRTSYLYDISGCIPLEEKYIKNEFTVEDILLAADSIKEIIYTMDKYMLDINGVLFDVAHIFCGINDDSWKYVYNSEMSSDAREGIKRVFEYMLGRLNHKDGNAVILGYGLYKRVCRDEIPLQRVFDNLEEFSIYNVNTVNGQENLFEAAVVEDNSCGTNRNGKANTQKANTQKANTGRAEKESTEKERGSGFRYELSRRKYPSVAQEFVKEEQEKKIIDKRYVMTAAAVNLMIAVVVGLIWGVVTGIIAALACTVIAVVVMLIILKGPSWEKIVTSEIRLPYETENPQIKLYGIKNSTEDMRGNMPESMEQQDKKVCETGYEHGFHREIETGWHNEVGDNESGQATIVIGMGTMKSLRRIHSAAGQDEYIITEDSVSIGCGASADIVIKDSGISRLHARIIREGEMYFIKDMNSTNGTWINDRRISVYELCPIKNGDVIKLAKSCFELIDTAV